MILRTIGLTAAALALVGCASGPRFPRERYARALAAAPGAAQPSRIVAREIEFLKAAEAQGHYAAAREFAAPQASALASTGDTAATSWGSALDHQDEVGPWSPTIVWMSCDGRFAVSEGRFENRQKLVGSYLTIWQRDRNGDYKWLHNAAALDDPQPPAKTAPGDPGPGAIVVPGLVSVDGNVTDCKIGEAGALPAAPGYKQALSPDQTLAWRWAYLGDTRIFEVHALTNGEWKRVIEKRWPANVGESN